MLYMHNDSREQAQPTPNVFFNNAYFILFFEFLITLENNIVFRWVGTQSDFFSY